MANVELFVQGEGDGVELVRVSDDGRVRDIVAAAHSRGLLDANDGESPIVMIEDEDKELDLDASLSAAGIGHRGRVHVHRCRRVEVTVDYNGRSINEDFPPSTTIRRVTKWALGEGGFDLRGVDATDHALRISNSTERPDEDTHLGNLVQVPGCSVGFDLAPKSRVEG